MFRMLEIIVKSNHIWVMALLQDGDFCLHEFLKFGHLIQFLQWSHLHSRFLKCACVLSQIDIGPITLSDQPQQAQVVNCMS